MGGMGGTTAKMPHASLCVTLCSTSTYLGTTTPHPVYGFQNENKMASEQRERVTNVWAKVRGCFFDGGTAF